MKLSMKKDRAGDWRWQLRSRNGRVIAEGGEGYRNEKDCRKALDQIADGFKGAYDVFVNTW